MDVDILRGICMRELKFRAWDGKQWRTDHFVDANGFIYQPWCLNSGHFTLSRVDWKLSRFTGLYDKDGSEIFENDIVRTGVELHHRGGVTQFTRNCEILWNEHDGAWNIKFRGEYKNSAHHIQPVSKFQAAACFKVTGDIFTTPELLEDTA